MRICSATTRALLEAETKAKIVIQRLMDERNCSCSGIFI
jgi:hypothetical protein